MRILVVDDSQTMRKIVRRALEEVGYSGRSVLEASDGLDAIARLREHKFEVDLILCDWSMPNMDGLTLLKQLQRVDRLKRIPFIMVTGQTQRSQVIEAIRAGARNYILKPFSADILREKVLAVEMEKLGSRKRSDTAAFRLEARRAMATPDADVPFVRQLPEELSAGLFEYAQMLELPAGEVLIEPDDIVGSLEIIQRGEVEILSDGEEGTCEVRGVGDCVGELSFLSGDPAGLRARAKTRVVIASVRKSDFEALVAEYPHMSFYLTQMLMRQAKEADARLGSKIESGLTGKLGLMALAEVVQTLHNGRKTGLLRLEKARGRDGDVYLAGGEVRHAHTGEKTGEEAFYHLLNWEDGSFAFVPGEQPLEPTIFRPTMGLLMEGMRRLDELRA